MKLGKNNKGIERGQRANGLYKSRDGTVLNVGDKVYFCLNLLTITDIFGGQSLGQLHFKETDEFICARNVFVSKDAANKDAIERLNITVKRELEDISFRVKEINRMMDDTLKKIINE